MLCNIELLHNIHNTNNLVTTQAAVLPLQSTVLDNQNHVAKFLHMGLQNATIIVLYKTAYSYICCILPVVFITSRVPYENIPVR